MKNYLQIRLLERTLLALTILIAIAYLLVNIIGIYLTGPYGWDDGAITLAYAKTLAEHGAFSLTGASEIVEGTSSLLYAFILSLLDRFVRLNFYGLIFSSQIISFLALCMTLFLVYIKLQVYVEKPLHRVLIVGLLGTLPMFTAEILNGMEMTLFCLLMLSLAISYQSKSTLVFAIIPLLLLVRFESIFYLSFTFAFLFYLKRSEREQLGLLFAYLILWFTLFTFFRWTYFNDVLPNTIWAKMNQPYSSGGDIVHVLYNKSRGLFDFIYVNLFLLCGAFGLPLLKNKFSELLDLKVFLILSFAVFAVITGSNSGYKGRMFLACLPLMPLMIAGNFSSQTIRTKRLHIKLGNWSPQICDQKFIVGTLVLCLLGTHLLNLRLYRENLETVIHGGYYQDRLPNQLQLLLKKHMDTYKQEFSHWYGVTPENYRITGLAVEKMRSVLDMPTIKFMAPDIGGLGLCCDKINVVDSALLANSFLAKSGYDKFDGYLRHVEPDVIETHGLWSTVSNIYTSDFFQNNYVPIIFDNNLFWIRKNEEDIIISSPKTSKLLINNMESLINVRYGGTAVDMAYIHTLHVNFIWSVTAN